LRRQLGAGELATIVSQVGLLAVIGLAVAVIVLAYEAPPQPRLVGALLSLLAVAAVALGLRRWLQGSGLLMTLANGVLLVVVVALLAQTEPWGRGWAFIIGSPVVIACLFGIGGGFAPPRSGQRDRQ
jgi:peptidoglycan/LPS O-acetylase OafA/YrhL